MLIHNQNNQCFVKAFTIGSLAQPSMITKIEKLSTYTQKKLHNRGVLDFQDGASLQSNLACTPLSYAILTLHGSC
jgi:hypothetical protein